MIFKHMNSILEKIDKLILFLIIYTLLFFTFFKTLSYTLPFVLALIFAVILKKPTMYLINKFKMKNSVATLIVTTIFFAIITLIMVLGINTIVNELIEFGKNAQAYISSNQDKINNFVNELQKYYKDLNPSITSSIESSLKSSFSKVSNVLVYFTSRTASFIVNFVASIPYLLMIIMFTLLSTYFFTKDIIANRKKLRSISNIIPSKKSDRMSEIFNESKQMLVSYINSYVFLIFMTFLETLLVFIIFKVKYAIVLSIIAAIADILPIVGISVIYIPLALIYFFVYQNYLVGTALIISYIIISVIRQILEPKVLSSSLGLHPVAVLAAIFIGLKANGFSGMFFCIFLVVFYNILKKVKVL